MKRQGALTLTLSQRARGRRPDETARGPHPNPLPKGEGTEAGCPTVLSVVSPITTG